MREEVKGGSDGKVPETRIKTFGVHTDHYRKYLVIRARRSVADKTAYLK